MNIFDEIRYKKTFGFDITDTDIKNYLQQDYNDLIYLRNRLSNDIECPNHDEIFEEDHILLDHILDYLEIFKEIVDKDNKTECLEDELSQAYIELETYKTFFKNLKFLLDKQ